MNDVCNVLNTIIEKLENEFKPKNIDIIERMVGKLDKKLDFESYFHTSVWTNSSMQYFCHWSVLESYIITGNQKKLIL